jgi:hypothetical protein
MAVVANGSDARNSDILPESGLSGHDNIADHSAQSEKH